VASCECQVGGEPGLCSWIEKAGSSPAAPVRNDNPVFISGNSELRRLVASSELRVGRALRALTLIFTFRGQLQVRLRSR